MVVETHYIDFRIYEWLLTLSLQSTQGMTFNGPGRSNALCLFSDSLVSSPLLSLPKADLPVLQASGQISRLPKRLPNAVRQNDFLPLLGFRSLCALNDIFPHISSFIQQVFFFFDIYCMLGTVLGTEMIVVNKTNEALLSWPFHKTWRRHRTKK